MNTTYCANGISSIPEIYKEQVYQELTEAIELEEQVCVVLNDFYYDDESYDVVLYGIYRNTDEWVSNYYNSGGLWGYCDPKQFLNQ